MVWRLLDRAEYKRRQAPPGVKISSRAFGRDRRYPISNAFQATGPVPREIAEPGETPRAPVPTESSGGEG
jgi:NAD+ synthase